MKPELEKLARHRLSRAKAAFLEGDYLLKAKTFMGAVNRFYYAAFYAARAPAVRVSNETVTTVLCDLNGENR